VVQRKKYNRTTARGGQRIHGARNRYGHREVSEADSRRSKPNKPLQWMASTLRGPATAEGQR